jgi:hypothetical protein
MITKRLFAFCIIVSGLHCQTVFFLPFYFLFLFVSSLFWRAATRLSHLGLFCLFDCMSDCSNTFHDQTLMLSFHSVVLASVFLLSLRHDIASFAVIVFLSRKKNEIL